MLQNGDFIILDQKYKDAIKLGFVFIVDDKGVRQTIISRKQALELGLKYYFTGKPCKHGHVRLRDKFRACLSCREQHTANWHLNNPEKIRKSNAKSDAKWRKNNPEKSQANILKWKQNNSEKVKAFDANWCSNNPEKVREVRLRRRARLKFIKTKFSVDEQQKMMIDQSYSCNICHKPFILKKECNCYTCKCIKDKSKLNGNLCCHADHIIPLASAEEYGKTVYHAEDFQLLCPSCNLRKGKKDMKEFIESIS